MQKIISFFKKIIPYIYISKETIKNKNELKVREIFPLFII